MTESISDTLTDNHAHAPVPDDETVSGLRIATIIVGVAITLPAFLVGAEIFSALGTVRGIGAIATSGLVLTILASLTMLVGARSRLSTYSIIQFPFGTRGALIVSGLISATLFGWYGVTAMLFGRAVSSAVFDISGIRLPDGLFVIFGSALMVVTTIYGFRAIDKLSRLAVPLLLLVMAAGVAMVLGKENPAGLLAYPANFSAGIPSFGAAVSLLIGSFMVGVVVTPDMARFSKSGWESTKGAVLSYGSGSQLVLIMAGLPALVLGSTDIVQNMIALGLGVPALLVIIFATWTTNANNLYSASLGLAQIFGNTRDWIITLWAGAFGTVLALAGILDYFVEFLVILSIAIPPIAGIYLTDFFLVRRQDYLLAQLNSEKRYNTAAFLAWFLGIAGAFVIGRLDGALTGVGAGDAILIAAIAYAVPMLIKRRKAAAAILPL